MPTEMYSIRVLAVEGNRLTLRVTVEYSGERLDPDRTLAFRFVWEPWFDMRDGKIYRVAEDGYGEEMPLQQEARERGQRAPLTRALAGQDMNDLDWCVENADRFIACVGVTDQVNYTEPDGSEEPGYDPEAKPQATYTIIVTDPAWIEHFTPGTWWPIYGFADDALPSDREMFGWLTPTVVLLVRGIDAENALDRLPILADALEEAGCDDAAILNHCRGEGEHVRGCWVVHLLQDAIRRLG